MTSNEVDEFSPSKKRLKLEAIESDEIVCPDVDTDDDDDESLLPNNLEHLPIEILMHIFTYTDDIGLLNLATNSCRFEKIANVVFADRYADKYFTIDNESERHQEIYAEQFSRFGSGIRAIKAVDIHGIDGNHWMAQMMHKHIGSRLQKLEFRNCSFKNGENLFTNYVDITHLAIFRDELDQKASYLSLPNYRSLRKLEIRNIFVDNFSLMWIFRNNAQLESIILCDASFPLQTLMRYVHAYMPNLKEFIVIEDFETEFPSDEDIGKFLDVTHGLESFGITIQQQHLDFYRRLSLNCAQNIKNLELFVEDVFDGGNEVKIKQMIEVTKSFKNVEMLSMNVMCVDKARILAIVENLPKLRQLCISQVGENLTQWVLELVQKCEHLDKLVIIVDEMSRPDYAPDDLEEAEIFHHHINAHFHNQLLNLKRTQPNFEIAFLDRGRTIGRVTKQEIVWRNKLMHWTGCDSICGNSKVNLLDLAVQGGHHIQQSSTTSSTNNGSSQHERSQPFDLILDYLDLNSLYALHKCSTRSKQLVEEYVKRHSEQGEAFLITDEFYLSCNGLKQFAPFVTHLNAEFLDEFLPTIILGDIIQMYFKNLTKLRVRAYNRIDPHQFIFSSVKHFIFYGYCTDTIHVCNVFRLGKKCKNLKILEIKTAMKLSAPPKGGRSTFANLQTFKFKPKNKAQIKLATELFGKMGTDIVVLD